MTSQKPTYEELERRILDLEKKSEELNILQQKHSDNEEKYRAIFEQAMVSIVILDINGSLIDFNSKVYENLGYSREEFVHLKSADIDVDKSPEDIISHHKEILKKGSDTWECRLLAKNGEMRDMLTNSTPMRIGGKIYFQNVSLDITDRKRAETLLKKSHEELEQRVADRTAELQMKTLSLEETNVALRVLLKRRDEDKNEFEDIVLGNVKELIIPSLEKMKMTKLNPVQETYISVFEENLNAITSPFIHRVSMKLLKFTPSEIQISNLIKQGRTSKEIADYLNLSPRTVDFHRQNIRKKLGLDNEKVNLRSYLLTM
jgi:PAS domain S-box-containing protein